jgi:protein-disulfide isomerase
MNLGRDPLKTSRSSPARRRLPLGWLTLTGVLAGALVITLIALLNQGGPPPTTPTGSATPARSAVGLPSGLPDWLSPPPSPAPVALADGRTLGQRDAPVRVDLWVDFQCPACAEFTHFVQPRIVATYVESGDARFNFHDLSFMGTESRDAAIAARCADQQSAFWPYHDLLFANQQPANTGWLTVERLKDIAAVLDLDLDAFALCMDNQAIADAVTAESGAGLNSGINETPALFVNGERVDNVMNGGAVLAAIAAALGDATPAP